MSVLRSGIHSSENRSEFEVGVVFAIQSIMAETSRSSLNSYELLSCLSLFQRSIHFGHFNTLKSGELFLPDLERIASPECLKQALDVQAWCRDHGVRILYPGHPDYPVEFFQIEKPPLFLSCWGSPCWLMARCLSVVGSREPSQSSLEWMELHLRKCLDLDARLVLVSGGARGIDQKAHLISIRSQRPTVVFLPSGLGTPFPAELGKWRPEILGAGGCLLSEYAPFQEVRKHHFVSRNRMIAALSSTLLVVEARRRSGSTMTARLAREGGRTLCVLPTFPGNARSDGSLDLLFDGAFPIRDAEDLYVLLQIQRVENSALPGSS